MAFGIQHYDVLNGAPQFPGYIVYIALAQAVNIVFNDPQRTMVFISILSSGLAAAALFYLGREMFSPITGLLAALFLISSPLFWFYGEIALPHSLDLLVITLAAWLLYKIMIGQTGWLWWTVVLLALIGGFRQQDLLFLAPLVIFTCYRSGVLRIILALALGGLVSLAWFIPLMAYSGGFESYLEGSSAFSASFFNSTSLLAGAGWTGLQRNLFSKLIPYTLYAWSLAILPAVVYGFSNLPVRWRYWLSSRNVRFILLWITPSIAFYIVIHMGQQGLVFTFLPALLLMGSLGLERLLRSWPSALYLSAAFMVLVNAGVFIFAPTFPLGEGRFKLLTYDTLREHDLGLNETIATVRQNFSNENTVLLAANWRHIQFYMPEYRLARFALGAKFEGEAGLPTAVDFVNHPMGAKDFGFVAGQEWHVVVIDKELESFAVTPLKSADKLFYLRLNPDDLYWTDSQQFGVKSG
jgi:4-amino-4-deoxy-L-arabinose transferase-like glycosyltransferase